MPLPVRLAPLLLLLTACGGSDPSTPGATTKTGGPAISLFQRGNCHTCHGPELKGTQLGPALGDLTVHWNHDSLVGYLNDPQGVADRDPRLRERRGIYMMRMPPAAQAGLSKEDVAALATWLLSPGRTP